MWASRTAVVVLFVGAMMAMAVTSVEASSSEQERRPHRWWTSDEVKTLLELSDDQSGRLGEIYQRTLSKQRESMRRLKAEERALSLLIGDMNVEEIDVTRQVDRVEAARSELSKTRTLMVFRMYRVLTESQRTKLSEWMRDDSEAADGQNRRRRC